MTQSFSGIESDDDIEIGSAKVTISNNDEPNSYDGRNYNNCIIVDDFNDADDKSLDFELTNDFLSRIGSDINNNDESHLDETVNESERLSIKPENCISISTDPNTPAEQAIMNTKKIVPSAISPVVSNDTASQVTFTSSNSSKHAATSRISTRKNIPTRPCLTEIRRFRFYTKANTWNNVVKEFNQRYECVKDSTMKLKEVECSTSVYNQTNTKYSTKIYECECQRKLSYSASDKKSFFNLHFAFSEYNNLYKSDGIYHLYYIKTRDVPVDVVMNHFRRTDVALVNDSKYNYVSFSNIYTFLLKISLLYIYLPRILLDTSFDQENNKPVVCRNINNDVNSEKNWYKRCHQTNRLYRIKKVKTEKLQNTDTTTSLFDKSFIYDKKNVAVAVGTNGGNETTKKGKIIKKKILTMNMMSLFKEKQILMSDLQVNVK